VKRRAGLVAMALLACGAAAVQSDDADDQALLADADYSGGLAALKAGDFAMALKRFQSALKRFPEAANLHNELGFSHRKLGQFEKAFEHYKRALAIDPRHRGAHEYIGEAYLQVGDVASAERHLGALRSICLLPCQELEDLSRAIAEYRGQTRPQ
jgi:tetratricopeptide (TPR) repeat protein